MKKKSKKPAPKKSPTPPEASAPSATLTLPAIDRTFHFDGTGECTNPLRVEVPAERGTLIALLLAQRTDGPWCYGCVFAGPDAVGSLKPNAASGPTEPTQRAALESALVLALELAPADTTVTRALAQWRAEHIDALLPGTEEAAARRTSGASARRAGCSPENTAAGEPDLALPGPALTAPTRFAALPLARIQDNPENHRKHFDPLRLRELADSLRANGLAQPIAVRALLPGEPPAGELPMPGDASAPAYECIFGHRRLRAARLLGWTEIEAKIYEGLNRQQATAIALIENLQREDINAMERAEGYAQLMRDEQLTQELCAARVGQARSTIANALRLLQLPEKVRELIRAGELTAGHGIALARFVPAEKDRDQVPNWEKIIALIAEQAVENAWPAGDLERGVPFFYDLVRAGLAVRVNLLWNEKLPAGLARHPAYHKQHGEWICFAPDHWAAEEKKCDEARRAKEEKERLAREKELAASKGRKQLSLADLDRSQYREFTGADAALNELVPEDKKAAAKGHAGRTTIVTDVQLADRLRGAMSRAVKANRRGATPLLRAKVEKKLDATKKVGPREFAWLVWTIVDGGAQNRLSLDREGCKLPPAVRESEEDYGDKWKKHRDGRLAALAKEDAVDLWRELVREALDQALADIEEDGPASDGAREVRWWLDSDTLWLLEETEEGRNELIETVKKSPAVQAALAGEKPTAEEEDAA